MPFLLQILGTPDGLWRRPGYLVRWDLDANDGRGSITVSPQVRLAHEFPSPASALRCYREIAPGHPTRGDGQANRPLTAYTIAVVRKPAATGMVPCEARP